MACPLVRDTLFDNPISIYISLYFSLIVLLSVFYYRQILSKTLLAGGDYAFLWHPSNQKRLF